VIEVNIFLAGASGILGRPCIRILTARKHRVFAMTRKPELNRELWTAGAVPIVVDAFEATPVRQAMEAIRPDAVLSQLTDLALLNAPGKLSDALAHNATLRKVGTANLVAASVAAGVGHYVTQSIAWVYKSGNEPYDEDSPLDLDASGDLGVSVDGVATMEKSVLDTPGLRGCVLRYGFIYGPHTGRDTAVDSPLPVHVEAAAWAAALAVEQQAAGIFNVAESNRRVQTDRIRRQLNWNESLRA
jgi:nucleoside-diphosphate-sugar epimerase